MGFERDPLLTEVDRHVLREVVSIAGACGASPVVVAERLERTHGFERMAVIRAMARLYNNGAIAMVAPELHTGRYYATEVGKELAP